jgi:hypothetical protein
VPHSTDNARIDRPRVDSHEIDGAVEVQFDQEETQMQFRQGDVLFVPIGSIPQDAKKRDPHKTTSAVLVEGEATGHHHSVATLEETEVLECGEGLYLRVSGDSVSIVHQEHAPITLPTGNFEVRRQREYQPEGIRNVFD